ncbi:hypothetical protein FRC02_000229 [Tulasnella sp. 418]|nr:hypothetical protein FRC02_000229 [Tulasnella sp. 418]
MVPGPRTKHSHIQPGLVSEGTIFVVPDAIQRKFENGWKEHIPLMYLTDKYCQNTASHVELKDVFTLDPKTNMLLTSISSSLSNRGEDQLEFVDWHAAWRRLLALIEEFFEDQDHERWLKHFSAIAQSKNLKGNWKTWLLYDIEVRRQAVRSKIDLGIHQVNIYNNCHLDAEKIRWADSLTNVVDRFKDLRTNHRGASGSSSRKQPYE